MEELVGLEGIVVEGKFLNQSVWQRCQFVWEVWKVVEVYYWRRMQFCIMANEHAWIFMNRANWDWFGKFFVLDMPMSLSFDI